VTRLNRRQLVDLTRGEGGALRARDCAAAASCGGGGSGAAEADCVFVAGEPNVSEELLFKCSALLARETLTALAQTFSGAKVRRGLHVAECFAGCSCRVALCVVSEPCCCCQAVMTWLARVASFVAKKTGALLARLLCICK